MPDRKHEPQEGAVLGGLRAKVNALKTDLDRMEGTVRASRSRLQARAADPDPKRAQRAGRAAEALAYFPPRVQEARLALDELRRLLAVACDHERGRT
jgi:hypothetical protein